MELRKRQVDVTYILNENENHQFKDIKNRLSFYKQLGKFFEKQLVSEK
jgi:dipeptidyl aminopeptidase/acylaminoacyl peptidase